MDGQTDYYQSITEAFSAASASAAGSKAEVKLLKDDSLWNSYISVSGGDITLDLNGYTLSSQAYGQVLFLEDCQMTIRDSSQEKTGVIRSVNGKGVYVQQGASLTMENGRIEGCTGNQGSSGAAAVYVVEGSLTVHDGELSGRFGVDVSSGSVTIYGGTIQGSRYAFYEYAERANVALYGGTYTGGFGTNNMTFAQILGTGSTYYNETTGSYLTEGLNQTGDLAVGETVSIKAVPVQITGQPSDLSLSYGYESSEAVLKVTAEKTDAATGEVTYQWCRAGTGEDGADEELADSENGYSGSQTDTLVLPESWKKGGMSGSFYCIVSCGGYSVRSDTVQAETAECEHEYKNGFCAVCGGYEPAVWNEASERYEISNGGQLFWFAGLVNGKADGESSTESSSGNSAGNSIGSSSGSDAGNGTGSSSENSAGSRPEKDPAARGILTADIALESRTWTAIGSKENPYTGNFDGGGHTISGLSIMTSDSYQGLFGHCGTGSVVQNLRVSGNIVITGNAEKIGGIVGYLKEGTVSGVVSTVNISNSGGAVKHVGGVVGALNDGTLSQAENRGSVTTSGSYDCIAGVAGYMWASTIEYSINLGTVSAGGSDAYVGGITGYSNTSNTIRSCYNYGAVSSGGETSCGAIIGWCRDPRTVLENCCYLENSAGRAAGKNGDTNKGPASEDRVYAKDEAAFQSGEVTWLLNGGSVAEDGTVTDPSGNAWGQTIPGGSLPVLGGAAVYRYETCDGVEGFTNDSSQAGKQEHQLDENYRCTVCGQQMAASVTANEKTAYYTDIEEAFKDACTAGSTAVVTLMADAKASETLTISEGSSVTLISGTDSEGNPYTISGDVSAADSGLINIRGGSLTLESGTVENGGNGTNAIAVNDGSFVMTGGTVRAASDWNSAICVYSGTADIRGGTASGDSPAGAYGAAAVGSSSTVLVSSGAVSGSGNGAGIYVHSGGRAEVSGGSMTGGAYGLQIGSGSGVLAGGTFTGTEAAVSIGGSTAAETVKSLLDIEKAYYKDAIAAENLITDLDGKTLPAGTVTVGACTHSYDTWTDANDREYHSGICVVCGHEEIESHTWDENGKCTAKGCTAQAAASVTVNGGTSYYSALETAWEAAKGHPEGASITLMADTYITTMLYVGVDDTINLNMADDVSLSGPEFFEGPGFKAMPMIRVEGGIVTLENGFIQCEGTCVHAVDGKFFMQDGTLEGGYAGISENGGYVEITGGQATGGHDGFNVWLDYATAVPSLSGGTFSSVTVKTGGSVGDLLAEGYAYRQNGAWVNNTTVTSLTGNVTVEEAPIKSVEIIAEKTTVTASSSEWLDFAVRTELSGDYTDSDVTYKWFIDGTQMCDTKYISHLAAEPGQYTFTCEAACDGYTVTSEPVVLTVRDPNAETISVEVSWDALEYTYTDGAWNPDTHTYGEGQWTADNGGNSITVKNTGSVDTTVSYQYSQSIEAVSGRFSGDDGNFIDSPVALAEGEEKKAYLALTGRPSSDFTTGTLGTVTVTIEGEE